MSPVPRTDTAAGKVAWSAAVAAGAPLEWAVPFLPERVLRRLQSARIRAAVAHAYEHVPFWRETMRREGLTPRDVRDLDGLKRLPIVERADLHADPERFVSQAVPRDQLLHRVSGGSVGEPVSIHFDVHEQFLDAIHRERRRFVQMRLARKARLRMTALHYEPEQGMRDLDRPFRERSLISPSLRMVRQTLSLLDEPAVNVEHINAFRPDIVAGHGSSVESLFVHVHLTDTPFHRPKLVVFGSDHMSEPGRRLITETFGVPVLSVYGATEVPNIAASCELAGPMHVNHDLCALRLVDDDGRDVAPGEDGEVLVSSLVSRGTMLFNYRLGDIASLDPERCACGRTLPVLRSLRGRRGMFIEDDQGGRLYSADMEELAAEPREVLRYQVSQKERDALRLMVVADHGADRDAVAERLRRRFSERLGDVRVEVDFVDDLPRTKHGKVLPVVRVNADGVPTAAR